MIPVDLTNKVNELQDALDEAKYLIELRHRHIVAYKDLFFHRGRADMKILSPPDPAALKGGQQNFSKGGSSRGSSTELGLETVNGTILEDDARQQNFVCIVMEHMDKGDGPPSDPLTPPPPHSPPLPTHSP
jgi:hypothetical protein